MHGSIWGRFGAQTARMYGASQHLLWAARLIPRPSRARTFEDLLGANRQPKQDKDQADKLSHTSSSQHCSAELQKMKTQAEMLRMLRTPEEVEPTAGFYARVMQRIEEQARESIWAAFIYSGVANRLVYGTLTVALVLSSYLVARESQDGHLSSAHRIVASNVTVEAPVFGDQNQQRNAVLANFEAY